MSAPEPSYYVRRLLEQPNAARARLYLGITGGTGGAVNFSAGATSSNLSAVTFSNANGVSFGLNALGVITGSVAPGGGGLTNIGVSAGAESDLLSALTFSNGSGVSFGLHNSTITASVNTSYLGSDQGSNFVAATAGFHGTNASGTIASSGISVSVGTAITAFPRLDQVLDPNTDKNFSMGSNQLQLSWQTGGSFSTNVTRQGMLELDFQGNLTQEADLAHFHIHGGAPMTIDLLHVEADGANETALRLQVSASIAAEINEPLKFTTRDSNYPVGSVPFILSTQMSNVVANLNADFVDGRDGSVLAGTGFTTATTSGAVLVGTLATNGISMGVPNWITTAGAAGMSALVVEASGSTNSVSTLMFSNANGVTFGLSGSTITGSVAAAGLSNIVVEASGATNSTSLIFFSNSNNVSFGLSNGTITASATVASTQASILVAASGSTNTVSQVTFSNSNNVSFGLSGSVITATASGVGAPTISFYANLPGPILSTNTLVLGASQAHMQPFYLPTPASFGFFRFMDVPGISSMNYGTSGASTTYSAGLTTTWYIGIYTQGSSASSLSLMYLTGTTGTWAMSNTISQSSQSYTVGCTMTYPVDNTFSQFTYADNRISANIIDVTSSWSNFTGLHFFDLPWNASLAAGAYWLGYGSGAASNTQGSAGLAQMNMTFQDVAAIQFTLSLIPMPGDPLFAQLRALSPGMGIFNVASLQNSSNVYIGSIVSGGAHFQHYFQGIRSA